MLYELMVLSYHHVVDACMIMLTVPLFKLRMVPTCEEYTSIFAHGVRTAHFTNMWFLVMVFFLFCTVASHRFSSRLPMHVELRIMTFIIIMMLRLLIYYGMKGCDYTPVIVYVTVSIPIHIIVHTPYRLFKFTSPYFGFRILEVFYTIHKCI